MSNSGARLLNKSSCLAAALAVAKFMTIVAMNLVTLCGVVQVRVRCSTNCGRFVELKLALSSSFRCDRIQNCRRYDFGCTLLCYSSQT